MEIGFWILDKSVRVENLESHPYTDSVESHDNGTSRERI